MATSLKSGLARGASKVRPFIDATSAVGDAAALQRQARAHGYVFVRRLAPRALLDPLRAEVLAQCARRNWLVDGVPQSNAVAQPDAAQRATRDELLLLQGDIQILPVWWALRSEPAILSVLEAILGAPPNAGCGDVCRLSFPADLERTTPPHQDHFYTRRTTSLWTVWIPLGDCPASLGGLAVLPGSHVGGLLPHDGGEGEARFIQLPDDAAWASTSYRAGDVLFLNALTVHAARPNLTTNRLRISADFRYQP